MKDKLQFGESVKGYEITVLNEREIRAAAGILFLGAFLSLMMIIFKGNFIVAKYFVIIFLIDILIRIYISPRYSPSLIIGRLIVSNQAPEYVGAPQKKFAWKIGAVLAIVMFILLVILNTYSFITGIICLICLLFLFFESAFGICLGCIFYKLVYKEKVQYCPGEVCDLKNKDEIQKTSNKQLIILFVFILVFILASILFLNNFLNMNPIILWELF